MDVLSSLIPTDVHDDWPRLRIRHASGESRVKARYSTILTVPASRGDLGTFVGT